MWRTKSGCVRWTKQAVSEMAILRYQKYAKYVFCAIYFSIGSIKECYIFINTACLRYFKLLSSWIYHVSEIFLCSFWTVCLIPVRERFQAVGSAVAIAFLIVRLVPAVKSAMALLLPCWYYQKFSGNCHRTNHNAVRLALIAVCMMYAWRSASGICSGWHQIHNAESVCWNCCQFSSAP